MKRNGPAELNERASLQSSSAQKFRGANERLGLMPAVTVGRKNTGGVKNRIQNQKSWGWEEKEVLPRWKRDVSECLGCPVVSFYHRRITPGGSNPVKTSHAVMRQYFPHSLSLTSSRVCEFTAVSLSLSTYDFEAPVEKVESGPTHSVQQAGSMHSQISKPSAVVASRDSQQCHSHLQIPPAHVLAKST